MKNKLKLGIGISILVIGLLAIGCNCSSSKEKASTQKEVAEVVYTCPMHPDVVNKEPGSCPDCGMDLVKKESETEHSHDGHTHD